MEDGREDEEKKEQSQRRTNQKNRVLRAKGAGGFEESGSRVNHSRTTKKNELRKGHWVYNCTSSFFMSSKQ